MKNYLYNTIIYWTFTMALVFIIILFDSPMETLLAGIAGASFVGGVINLSHYFHWSQAENKEESEARQDKWDMDLAKETKEHLLDKAGRISYKIGLMVIALAILGFILLDSLSLVDNALVFVLFLLLFLLFEYFIGILIYRKLTDRYELRDEIKEE